MPKTARLQKDTFKDIPLERNSKMSKCLVSGAQGFLGSSICDSLIAQNCYVIAIDNKENTLDGRLEKLKKYSNFSFIKHDLNQGLPNDIGKIDYVFHLAGLEENFDSKEPALQSLLLNSIGTEHLASCAISNQAKFVLASTIDVYYGALSGVSLEYYFGASKDDFAHYSHHEAKRYAEALLAEYYRTKQLDIRVCRIGDLYGPGMDLDVSFQAANLLKQSLTSKKINVLGDGLEIIYPTYISDVSYGIIKSIFSQDTSGKIFSLVPDDGVTVKIFVETLKEVVEEIAAKNLEINFDQSFDQIKFPTRQPDSSQAEEILGWEAKTTLKKGLIETVSFFNKKEIKSSESENQEFRMQTEKRQNIFSNYFRNILVFSKKKEVDVDSKNDLFAELEETKINGFKFLKLSFLIFFSFILALFLKVSVDITYSIKLIDQTHSHFQDHDFSKASLVSQKALIMLNKLSNDIETLDKYTGYNFKSLNSAHKILNVAINSTQAMDALSSSAIHLSKFGSEVLKTENSKQNLAKPLNQSENFYSVGFGKLSFAVAELNSLPNEAFVFGLGSGEIDQLKQKLSQQRENLNQLKVIYQIIPQLTGFNQRLNYLVILQNNLEIRATGGFIGSYAKVNFGEGHLLNLAVDDIYNIDGQLKEKIPPPAPLKKYLNIDRWYLRDSNWDPNLPISAPVILDFYQKETGQTADALIAIDVNFIQSLLTITGPIYLDDFGETITDQNLFAKAEYYSEIGFIPGSQNKKNFLANLTNQLLAKLLSPEFQVNLPKVGNVIVSAASEKHFQTYFKNATLQELADKHNWTGKLSSLINPSNNKIETDYLLIVDSNVGANKANNFITRTINYHPVIRRDGDLQSEVTITYKNNSPANTWPGGNYKNYLRIYTPAGSVIEKIDNNGNTDAKQIEVAFTNDKVVYSFLVEVPVQKEIKVALSYKQPLVIGNEDLNYRLIVQKQAGTGKDPLLLRLDFPSYLKANEVIGARLLNNQSLEISSDLQTDKKFQINFKRN